jgi:hypothetical protein
MAKTKSPLQQQTELMRFRRGCREALRLLDEKGASDPEHNELARRLGRPDLVRDLQTDIDLEPPSCA